jgi:hypothetical protein
MRSVVVFLAILAVASGVWAMIAAYRMGAWLSNHGVKVNWLWYRVTMPWYVHLYKTMTTEREGKVGALFTHFTVMVNIALLLGIATIVGLALSRG